MIVPSSKSQPAIRQLRASSPPWIPSSIRMRSQLGPAKATTATAHNLAKILYHMLKEKVPYRARRAEE